MFIGLRRRRRPARRLSATARRQRPPRLGGGPAKGRNSRRRGLSASSPDATTSRATMWFCSLHADDVNHSVAAPPPSSRRIIARLPRRPLHVEGPRAFSACRRQTRRLLPRLFRHRVRRGLAPFQSSRRHLRGQKTSIRQTTAFYAAAELRRVCAAARRAVRRAAAARPAVERAQPPAVALDSERRVRAAVLGRGARRANATAQLWVNAMADDRCGTVPSTAGLTAPAATSTRSASTTTPARGRSRRGPIGRRSIGCSTRRPPRGLAARRVSSNGILVVVVDRRLGGHAGVVGQRSLPAMRECVRAAGRLEVRGGEFTRCSTACTRRSAGGAHFGVLRQGPRRKPAFEVLADQLRVSLNS